MRVGTSEYPEKHMGLPLNTLWWFLFGMHSTVGNKKAVSSPAANVLMRFFGE